MKRLLSAVAPCALLVLAHAAPALAQQPPAQTAAAYKIREAVQKWPTLAQWATARPARSAFENEETTAAQFAALDANGDGKLDAADQALHRRIVAATAAANAVALIMAVDLDGDGEVSREEAKTWSEYRRRQSAAGGNRGVPLGAAYDIVAQAMLSADRDGGMSYAGAVAFARARQPASDFFGRDRDQAVQIGDLLGFTGAADTGLTIDGFRAALAQIQGAVPTSVNSMQMRQAEQSLRQAEEKRARADRCKMPAASEQAKVMLLSAREGDKFSPVAIGSQATEILTATIEVERGEQPIYLVVKTIRGTLWRFTGATERLERVVLHASEAGGAEVNPRQTPLVGATGVPKEKLTFLTDMSCLEYFSRVPSIEATLAAGVVREGAGREPSIFAGYRVGGFVVPSGKVIEAVSGATIDPPISSDIDPAQVVASLPPVRFEVLPGDLGLHQLEKSGALRQIGSHEYLVTQKVRLPAHLGYGRFLVQRGVPDPEGGRPGLCVVREETGKPVDGATDCR